MQGQGISCPKWLGTVKSLVLPPAGCTRFCLSLVCSLLYNKGTLDASRKLAQTGEPTHLFTVLQYRSHIVKTCSWKKSGVKSCWVVSHQSPFYFGQVSGSISLYLLLLHSFFVLALAVASKIRTLGIELDRCPSLFCGGRVWRKTFWVNTAVRRNRTFVSRDWETRAKKADVTLPKVTFVCDN